MIFRAWSCVRIPRVCLHANLRKYGENIGIFENLAYLDDPQCSLGILRHCIGSQKWCVPSDPKTPTSSVIKSLKDFDAQQREKLENILGTVLPEQTLTQATPPITLSGLGVRLCQDQYKASYVGSVLSSEELVSKITGENPKKTAKFLRIFIPI